MELVWKDRKRTFLGLPLSFTVYSLDSERLFIKKGALSISEDEIRLYRIKDITLRRSFGQRLLGLGTIHCCSSDATMQEFDIKNIKKSRDVRELLSQMIEEERQPLASAYDARKVLEMINGAYASQLTGRVVPLPLAERDRRMGTVSRQSDRLPR